MNTFHAMQVDLEGAREDIEALKRDLEESRSHKTRLEAALSSANQAAIKASEISSPQVCNSNTRELNSFVLVFT